MSEDAAPFRVFTDRFEELGINYFVTGSVAGIIYGEPRMTHDVDVVLDIQRSQLAGLAAAFPLDGFYAPPLEVLEVELRRESRGHFNLIHHETGFKAYVYLRGDALHAWAFQNRRRIDLGDGSIWLAPPEYVILRKLQYYAEGGSSKHLTDIRSILTATPVDEAFITTEATAMGLGETWRRAAAEVR